MFSLDTKGNPEFTKSKKFMEHAKDVLIHAKLDSYGRQGVAALSSATPMETGTTASSWYYEISKNPGLYSISFKNSHINKGVNIAIILQYGHGTGTGGYVQGRDYINPAVRPVFDSIVEALWKEVILYKP